MNKNLINKKVVNTRNFLKVKKLYQKNGYVVIKNFIQKKKLAELKIKL